MRRTRIPLLIGLLFLVATTTWSASGIMSVQVQSGQLRATPSFLGPIVGSVTYGTQVELLQQQGEWMQVSGPGNRKGWMHQSALTKKRVVLDAGGQNAPVAASGEELALAGKGFNAGMEARFKADHRDVDFAWVDRMERFDVSRQQMLTFLESGGLQPREGGVR